MIGYLLGNIEVVQKNFELVVFGIVGLSIVPIIFGVVRKRMEAKV